MIGEKLTAAFRARPPIRTHATQESSRRGAKAQRSSFERPEWSSAPRCPCERFLFVPVICICCLAGCGATQLSSSNRHLLEAVQTAVSAKNDQWLEAAAKQVEEQRSKGQMSESEHKALASIIDLAKSGKWDAAQSHIFALSEGQRPTAEDVARVQKRAAK